MAYGTYEDTRWAVDIDNEVQWRLRHAPDSMTDADRALAAGVMDCYELLTSPDVDDDTAQEDLRRARVVADEIIRNHLELLSESTRKQYVVVTGSAVYGPYTLDEAKQKGLAITGSIYKIRSDFEAEES